MVLSATIVYLACVLVRNLKYNKQPVKKCINLTFFMKTIKCIRHYNAFYAIK